MNNNNPKCPCSRWQWARAVGYINSNIHKHIHKHTGPMWPMGPKGPSRKHRSLIVMNRLPTKVPAMGYGRRRWRRSRTWRWTNSFAVIREMEGLTKTPVLILMISLTGRMFHLMTFRILGIEGNTGWMDPIWIPRRSYPQLEEVSGRHLENRSIISSIENRWITRRKWHMHLTRGRCRWQVQIQCNSLRTRVQCHWAHLVMATDLEQCPWTQMEWWRTGQGRCLWITVYQCHLQEMVDTCLKMVQELCLWEITERHWVMVLTCNLLEDQELCHWQMGHRDLVQCPWLMVTLWINNILHDHTHSRCNRCNN